MLLKNYQIDGRLLRTGAANFSASGLKRQDNDLIVIESAEAARKFKSVFEDGPFLFVINDINCQPVRIMRIPPMGNSMAAPAPQRSDAKWRPMKRTLFG